MNKERIDRMMNEILSVSKSLDSSLGKVEDKLVEGVGKDLKNTIKILEVLGKFNHLRLENIMTINNASRARKLIQVVEVEDVIKRFGNDSPVTMKDFKDSIKAHNGRREEAGANDAYNRSKGLGTYNGRSLVGKIASDKSGSNTSKVTMNDAISWAHSQIMQEVKPYYRDVVKQLQSTEHPKTGSTVSWKGGESK